MFISQRVGTVGPLLTQAASVRPAMCGILVFSMRCATMPNTGMSWLSVTPRSDTAVMVPSSLNPTLT